MLMKRSLLRVVGAAAIVVVATLGALALERTPRSATSEVTAPSPSTASASIGASSTPSATAPTTAGPASLSPSPIAAPTPGVAAPPMLATMDPARVDLFVPPKTRGIGQLTGDWVFVLSRSVEFGTVGIYNVVPTSSASDTLILVPLNDPSPQARAVPVATFLSALGDGIVATNMIGAQLSPDGDRVVLSVGMKRPDGGLRLGLIVIDLATGASRALTTDPSFHDDTPAWSPNGMWIAFTRRSVTDGRDAGVWITSPEPGTNVRGPLLPPLTQADRRTSIYSWTPDGQQLAISRGEGRYEFFDPFAAGGMPCVTCSPAVVTALNGTVPEFRDAVDWRRTTPQFVGAFAEGPRGGAQTIEVADGPAAPQRVVARMNVNPGVLLVRPRWRPGSDDILYLESPTGVRQGSFNLMIVSAGTGASRRLTTASSEVFAEWSPDGGSVVWLEARGFAQLRAVRVDGSGQRVLLSGGGVPEAIISTVDFGTLRF